MENMLNSINYRKDMNWIVRSILYLLLYFVFNLAISIGVGLILGIILLVLNLQIPLFLYMNDIYINLFSFSLMILISILTIFIFEKSNIFKRLGLVKKDALKKYFIGYLIGFILIILSSLPIIIFFTNSFSLSNPIYWKIIFGYFMFFIIQGASEEILVRGLFFPMILKHTKPITAILITSFGFGALHIFNPNITILSFINLTLVGILFCYCVLYFDSLWEACALHSAWNFIQGNILGFEVSGLEFGSSLFKVQTNGSNIFTGGMFGVEGSIFCSIITMIACIIFHILCTKKGISIFSKQINNNIIKTY